MDNFGRCGQRPELIWICYGPAAPPPPTTAFSPAPVSLSTRASMPTRPPKPTPRPTPTGKPKPSRSSPKPQPTQPRPREVMPLPPSREPSLRSAGGGSEAFVDFANTRPEPVVVFWLDYDGQRQQYAVLQSGQS
ncbi:hypothetical protein [Micromonospora kangleipakensis]|uniref:hypothetical protein n=1 Tax=Micromonospora kangleipakensis TaxID=1077942 RepID=UPI0013EF1D8B|nr:hypothetical protein [Micromonospora kangleipakensis]